MLTEEAADRLHLFPHSFVFFGVTSDEYEEAW